MTYITKKHNNWKDMVYSYEQYEDSEGECSSTLLWVCFKDFGSFACLLHQCYNFSEESEVMKSSEKQTLLLRAKPDPLFI